MLDQIKTIDSLANLNKYSTNMQFFQDIIHIFSTNWKIFININRHFKAIAKKLTYNLVLFSSRSNLYPPILDKMLPSRIAIASMLLFFLL